MLLVIADTSPIRYLVQIGHIDLLHSLFQTVSIPTGVAGELSDPSAPPGRPGMDQDMSKVAERGGCGQHQ
jgi:predicted nucleic acid-binding protein